MGIDTYTKVVLTFIAGCLLYLCAQTRIQTVHAATGAQPVFIVGSSGPLQVTPSGVMPVGIVGTAFNVDTRTWGYFTAIPVRQAEETSKAMARPKKK